MLHDVWNICGLIPSILHAICSLGLQTSTFHAICSALELEPLNSIQYVYSIYACSAAFSNFNLPICMVDTVLQLQPFHLARYMQNC